MIKYFKNDEGVALIMVIIMLVVVGGLSAALLLSSRGHVSTAVHEQDMSQAFHSAEAGVEYVRANMPKVFDAIEDENTKENEVEGYYIGIDDSDDEKLKVYDHLEWLNAENVGFNETTDIEFSIKIESNDNNFATLISRGQYNDYTTSIKFDINKNVLKGTGEFDKPLNIKKRYSEKGDHFKLSGGDKGESYEEENINVTGFENGLYSSDDDIWHGIDNFEDLWKTYLGNLNNEDFDNIDELHYLNGDYGSKDEINGEKIADKSGEIFVIDGSFKLEGNDKLQDSLFIIKDYFHIAGGGGQKHVNFDNSLFLVFGETGKGENDYFFHDSGVPATRFDDFDSGIIEDIIGNKGTSYDLENWQQQ